VKGVKEIQNRKEKKLRREKMKFLIFKDISKSKNSMG
jgi:hypothetical protein